MRKVKIVSECGSIQLIAALASYTLPLSGDPVAPHDAHGNFRFRLLNITGPERMVFSFMYGERDVGTSVDRRRYRVEVQDDLPSLLLLGLRCRGSEGVTAADDVAVATCYDMEATHIELTCAKPWFTRRIASHWRGDETNMKLLRLFCAAVFAKE